MKSITVTCALLLLASCAQKEGTITGDSSPIIISDGGSVHVNQPNHFLVHGGKKAAIKLGRHNPTILGYQCDPNAGTCTAGDCTRPTAQSKCQINLTNFAN